MTSRILLSGMAAAVLATAIAGQASALTITSANGGYTVGIGAGGELFDGNPYIGMRRNADGYDPISPGTPRDSWGLNGNYADGAFYGYNGVSTILSGGGATATATTTTADGFTVVMNYSFVGDAQNILKIDTLVTNLGQTAQNALFQRGVDWDPPVTFYNETFGPFGTYAPVVESSYFGFESPEGAGTYGDPCTNGCDNESDNGAAIRINLGLLGSGQSSGFAYYYGLNTQDSNVYDLIAQTQAAGAAYVIAGQSTENGALPGLAWLNDAGLAAGAFEAVVLSFGLADRALMIRRDRDEVRVLADKDSLTQALNRRAWNEAAILAMSDPSPRSQSLLFLDLDHFKILNDQRGHAAGDEALVAVSHALREELRPADLFGRYGGEEFVALLDGAGEEEAMQVATRLCRRIHRLEISVDEAHPQLTVSIGVAVRRANDSIDSLVARADQAMYDAKLAGRNRASLQRWHDEPAAQRRVSRTGRVPQHTP